MKRCDSKAILVSASRRLSRYIRYRKVFRDPCGGHRSPIVLALRESQHLSHVVKIGQGAFAGIPGAGKENRRRIDLVTHTWFAHEGRNSCRSRTHTRASRPPDEPEAPEYMPSMPRSWPRPARERPEARLNLVEAPRGTGKGLPGCPRPFAELKTNLLSIHPNQLSMPTPGLACQPQDHNSRLDRIES